jgi:histidine kinase
MSEEVKHKIFEPFYTTKKVGKGTGLGVSISYGIIKDYKGSIEIESEVGKGTTFTLTFPQAPEVE